MNNDQTRITNAKNLGWRSIRPISLTGFPPWYSGNNETYLEPIPMIDEIHPNEAKSHECGWTRDRVEEYCSAPLTERAANFIVEDMRKKFAFSESVKFFVRLTKEWQD